MLPTFCPRCRAETRDGARFCHACGTALMPDAPVAAAVAVPTAMATAGGMAAGISPSVVGTPPAAPMPFPYPPQGLHPAPMPYPLMPSSVAPRQSGKATAGFCIGLVAFIIGWALTWVGTIIGVCGLVFSLIGLRETGRRAVLPSGPRTGRGLAIAGAVLSLLGIALSLAFLIYVLNHLADFGIVWPPERTR